LKKFMGKKLEIFQLIFSWKVLPRDIIMFTVFHCKLSIFWCSE
jgi:hypothetical protein